MLRSALLRQRAAAAAAASSRDGSRYAQTVATAGGQKKDDGDGTTAKKKAVPTPIATAMALAEQLEHPESSRIGRSFLSRPSWTPDAEGSGLTNKELARAKQSLELLHERIERDCEVKSEDASSFTAEQRKLFREVETTKRLGRMLIALMRQGNYRDIEGVAFLWNEIFPQHAQNGKHWGMICEHYAVALNKQRRYSEVVEKFFTNWLVGLEEDDTESATMAMAQQWLLTPGTVPPVLLACCHLKDADTAVRVLRIARERGVRIAEASFYQPLEALLRDDPGASFEAAMKICDVIVREMGSHVPLAVQPRLIKAAAERGEVSRAMQYYHHPREAPMGANAEHHFDVCLLRLWNLRCVPEMLVVLKHVVESKTASRDLKECVSKGLLRKSVEERNDGCREQAMQGTMGVLELMEKNRIRASNKPFPLLLSALLEDGHIDSVDGFVEFMGKYPHVMQWNEFMVCELLLVAVRLKQVDLIDDIVAHALNNGIPVKYVALESVIALYYRTGKFSSVEKAADIIRALRMNKHIPLGMALSEIGMACNSKLRRPEEVILLFEDFARRDGDRKRILDRKPMLQAAANAYSKLRRYDEANAIRQLLETHHPTDEPDAADDWSDSDSDEETTESADEQSESIRARSV